MIVVMIAKSLPGCDTLLLPPSEILTITFILSPLTLSPPHHYLTIIIFGHVIFLL